MASILTALSPQAFAADDDANREHALRSGEVVPIEQLLREIRQRFAGQILEVELDQEWRKSGRIWVYEAKVLTPEDEVLKLEYDARSLELIEVERPGPEAGRSGGGD